MYPYPPAPIIGVPAKTATPDEREQWLRQMPLSMPIFEPGSCGVDSESSDQLCDMYRICNRTGLWSEQFMPATKSIENIEFASVLAKQFDLDFDHVTAMMLYGDGPGWLERPNNDMIFIQQPIPKTLEELKAIVGGFHKSLFGKPKDNDTSVLDGTSTSPLSMTHAGTFPILKSTELSNEGKPKHIYQCIFDCSNTTKTIVIKEDMYDVKVVPTLTSGLEFE